MIHIFGGNISLRSLRILDTLPKLEGLLLDGEQFDDGIIPYIMSCPNLRDLSVQCANLSTIGQEKLKNELKGVKLWLPN